VEQSWGPLSLLRVGQVDADPAPEILVAEHAGSLSMFDGVTHARSVLVDTGVTALETVPRRPGGRSDVVVGTADGRLFRLRVGRRAPEPIGSYGASIDGLAVRDLTGDGIADYVFAVEGEVWIVHGRTGAVLWRSERLDGQSFSPTVGVHDSLLVADVDLDGRQEILVNTGRVGVDIYEIPPP
jgi:hypothetical protein